jgi:hypothetical protein
MTTTTSTITSRVWRSTRRHKRVDSVHIFGLLAPFTRRIMSILHQAGLLASGSRALIGLPILANSGLLDRGDEALASYSSATASALHRLPYSAEIVDFSHLMEKLKTYQKVVYPRLLALSNSPA